MTISERYKKVIEWFQASMPVAETELHYENPYQLLVCRDPVGTMYRQADQYDHPCSISSISYSGRYGYRNH